MDRNLEITQTGDTQMSKPDTQPTDPERHDTDDYNDQWQWSEGVTKTVTSLMRSPSLKVCTGETPACDHNLDKDPLPGVTMVADMFSLPYQDNTFEFVVSDPPWRQKTLSERQLLWDEVFRVTQPGGLIVYNATWIPEHERAVVREEGFRQEDSFWGNNSFLMVYQKTPTEAQLLEMYDVDDDRRLHSDDFGGNAPWQDIDPEYLTDPRIVTPGNDFVCPECGGSDLSQHRDEELSGNYSWTLYQCMDPRCAFRPTADEVYQHRAAERSARSAAGAGEQRRLGERDDVAHPKGTPSPQPRDLSAFAAADD